MTNAYNRIIELIKPRPTTIQGLRYFPDLEPQVDNNSDAPPFGWTANQEISDGNRDIVRQAVEYLTTTGFNAAMEIGVDRSNAASMSRIIMEGRPAGSFYLGVDINDKSYLNNAETNTWTLQCNSHDQTVIREFIASKNITQLDLLFIDGWHSVNTCVNDWRYTDLLRPGGIVLLHDSNSHPGCAALFDAVDDTMYDKARYCTDDSDFGIAAFVRKF